ncbi:hypothetical protein U1Q18_032470 [Sarracenia purpurea var. burkii]
MSSQPPQASQAHSTPTVRPPQGVVGSAGTPVAQGTAAPSPATSVPATSTPFPAVQVQKTAAQASGTSASAPAAPTSSAPVLPAVHDPKPAA